MVDFCGCDESNESILKFPYFLSISYLSQQCHLKMVFIFLFCKALELWSIFYAIFNHSHIPH